MKIPEWILAGFPRTKSFSLDDELKGYVKIEEIKISGKPVRLGVYVKVGDEMECRLVGFSLEGFESGLGGIRVYKRKENYFLVDLNEGRAKTLTGEELESLKGRLTWLEKETS